MSDIRDVRGVYQRVYSETKGLLGNWPVLAGGAVRSALMGEEPKDWDFYVNSAYLYDSVGEDEAKAYHKRIAEKFDAIAPPAPEEYHIHGLAPAGHFIIGGVDCNVILYDSSVIGDDPTKNFDFTCCIGSFTGHRFHNLDVVAGAISSGTLSLHNRKLAKRQVISSLGRVKKFKERYGWELDDESNAQFLRWRGEHYLLEE